MPSRTTIGSVLVISLHGEKEQKKIEDKKIPDPGLEFFKYIDAVLKGDMPIVDIEDLKKHFKFNIYAYNYKTQEQASLDRLTSLKDIYFIFERSGNAVEFRILPHELLRHTDILISEVFAEGLRKFNEEKDKEKKNEILNEMREKLQKADVISDAVNFFYPFTIFNGLLVMLPYESIALTDLGGLLDILQLIRIQKIKKGFSKIMAPMGIILRFRDNYPYEEVLDLQRYRELITKLGEYVENRYAGLNMYMMHLVETKEGIFLGTHPFVKHNTHFYGGLTPLLYIMVALNNELKKYPKIIG